MSFTDLIKVVQLLFKGIFNLIIEISLELIKPKITTIMI